MRSDPRTAPVGESWCRAERALWRRTLDGVLVLAPGADAEPVALRGSAAEIWELLAEPHRADELTAALAATYGVATSRVAADVDGALDTLGTIGALCRH